VQNAGFLKGRLFSVGFPVRKTEQKVKLGVWWLGFFFAFLGDWICFLSEFGWEQILFGREHGKKLALIWSAKALVTSFCGDVGRRNRSWSNGFDIDNGL